MSRGVTLRHSWTTALLAAVLVLWVAAASAEESGPLGCGIFEEEAAVANASGETPKSIPCVDLARKTYEYTASENRDPFESLIRDEKEKPGDGKTPPELYDLNLIKLKAIINDGDKGFALIQLPDSKHYTVEINSKIGTKNGRIIDIRDDKVIIRQIVINFRQEEEVQTRELKLREEEEQ